MPKSFQKKKDREKKVKKKLLRNREIKHKEEKAKRLEELRLETEYHLKNGKPQPIIVNEQALLAREEAKNVKAIRNLDKNIAILEELEKEYDKEHLQQEDIKVNKISDKLAALMEKAKQC